MPSAKAVSACSEFMIERVVKLVGYCKFTIVAIIKPLTPHCLLSNQEVVRSSLTSVRRQ